MSRKKGTKQKPQRSKEESTEQLLKMLHALGEAVQFCVSGRRDVVLPGLTVEGVGEVSLPIQPQDARQLIQVASQAPYGRGEETIVDTDVRRVWQIEPALFSFRNPQWPGFIEDIAQEVKKTFGLKQSIRCELYKLLIYEEGSFFAPHRDSEKQDGMFATLVVCLPSQHQGGALIVQHDGQSVTVDFGGEEGAYSIQYAAFYTDCRHEIKPVTSGYRVSLIYNLSLPRKKQQPQAPSHQPQAKEAATLLSDIFADESVEKIAIPCKHQYTEAGLHPGALKGTDRVQLAVLTRAAEMLDYQIYLALMLCHQEGSADEASIGYRWGSRYANYNSNANETADFMEIIEESLSLQEWFDPAGQAQDFGEITLQEEELLSPNDFEDFAMEQKVHEATGNEGVSLERWYRHAVMVIWPRSRHFRILAGEGQQAGVSGLARWMATLQDPAHDESCHTFATEIMNHWRFHRPAWQYKSLMTTEMLELLYQLKDVELIERFLREILPKEQAGTEGEILHQICKEMGWRELAPTLQFFFEFPDKASLKSLTHMVQIFADLCARSKSPSQEQTEVCSELAATLLDTIQRCDISRPQPYSWEKPASSKDLFTSFFLALYIMEETSLLERFLEYAFANPKQYDLHQTLIPTARQLYPIVTTAKKDTTAYQQLAAHCLQKLQKLTARPIPAPTDWAQKIKLSCQCADCNELQTFLHDPDKRVLRLPLNKERRRHLHNMIDSHKCDMDHVTERRGSPYTMVCTKNRASYEAKCRRFEENTQLLAELQQLQIS